MKRARSAQLDENDRARVCAYAAERIGFDYDLKNVLDLLRYLIPLPVPQRWRRRMIALGSGHPTRIICSALIAQAFETVRYPILPKVTWTESEAARKEILEIRHSSLYAPRDFDISPYFEVVKPTLAAAASTTRRWPGPTCGARCRRHHCALRSRHRRTMWRPSPNRISPTCGLARGAAGLPLPA